MPREPRNQPLYHSLIERRDRDGSHNGSNLRHSMSPYTRNPAPANSSGHGFIILRPHDPEAESWVILINEHLHKCSARAINGLITQQFSTLREPWTDSQSPKMLCFLFCEKLHHICRHLSHGGWQGQFQDFGSQHRLFCIHKYVMGNGNHHHPLLCL